MQTVNHRISGFPKCRKNTLIKYIKNDICKHLQKHLNKHFELCSNLYTNNILECIFFFGQTSVAQLQL